MNNAQLQLQVVISFTALPLLGQNLRSLSSPPSAMTTVAPPAAAVHIDLWPILSESKRIINAHSRHFLALSVLFLLPLSFSFSAYPFINQLFSQSSPPSIETHFSFLYNPLQNPPIFPIKYFFTLLYILFVFIFSLFATGSITYSVFHGFYGRPVKLVSAIKSAFTSFFPLLSTCLVMELILSGILVILGLIFLGLLKLTQVLGFQVNYASPYFLSLCLVFLITFMLIVFYLQIKWSFAQVVVVVESSWGLEPLKRSKNLVRGLKRVSFSMLLFFGLFSGILMWVSAAGWDNAAAVKWKNSAFILHIVLTSALFMSIMLSYLAATTVFYMYSKAIHGELAWEIAEEFAREYVSLPFDDEKVPHVVSVVYG
ncbi:hypothetical protein F3Y22_tig00109926pilonHSYRG00224 [Hibiscus syriacus]|uniref:Uncharacterized protein n=1 Tax=Hibiscus syriacus TaxID=106335 RepID=A0A6A3BWI6_HIBSY|nr:uncharacterized protein LOC120210762 [Hibiscus syriacus]KAE8719798.1 hypothetical protein F3Y22_tig00109926pilonHSYRG00224 [Hibiscus syriacus]